MKHVALLLFAVACGGDPTGSTCPTTNPPTYDTFGRMFFTTYCTDCHSATATNRHGAPGDQNFDNEADIRKHISDIDTIAASGPAATNTDMPELNASVPSEPSMEERALLGQYLACLQAQ